MRLAGLKKREKRDTNSDSRAERAMATPKTNQLQAEAESKLARVIPRIDLGGHREGTANRRGEGEQERMPLTSVQSGGRSRG